MTTLAATIVVPTHDHGPLVELAVRSALEQSVREIEVFVMGDGVTQETRAAVTALVRSDPRVRFFDHPKGPRLGEHYRHAALAEARGEIVTYLGDDDLYLPQHVALVRAALANADFAAALNVAAGPDGPMKPRVSIDVAAKGALEHMLAHPDDGIGLSRISHTLAAYRRLPHGWRTTPIGLMTDRYMVQQFMEQPWLRAVSLTTPSVLRFPSKPRADWTLERRRAEMAQHFDRVRDPAWCAEFVAKIARRQERDRSR